MGIGFGLMEKNCFYRILIRDHFVIITNAKIVVCFVACSPSAGPADGEVVSIDT